MPPPGGSAEEHEHEQQDEKVSVGWARNERAHAYRHGWRNAPACTKNKDSVAFAVMAGLVPAIHDLFVQTKDVDARHKAGHDEAFSPE
jgi:hypothetical protein